MTAEELKKNQLVYTKSLIVDIAQLEDLAKSLQRVGLDLAARELSDRAWIMRCTVRSLEGSFEG